MSKLVSTCYDDLEVGSEASYSRTVSERDIVLFGAASGDINPVHFDADYASTTQFGERIAHGMLSASLISTCIATQLPGPGSIYLGQELNFRLPVKIGDRLTASITVKEKVERRQTLVFDCRVTNQHDKLVLSGEARVKPPAQSGAVTAPALPSVEVAGLPAESDHG